MKKKKTDKNSNTLSILVVDDEVLSRQKIIRFIEEYPGDFNVFEADHGLKALEIIEKKSPDIVFLDIEMPEINGMDLVGCLTQSFHHEVSMGKTRSPGFKLIFQTAYSEFAVEAFEKNALDYLLKPFDQKRFNQALEKALKDKNTSTSQLTKLSSKLTEEKIYLSQIIVKRGLKSTLIPIEDVFWFKSENHYTYACTENFEYIYTEALKDLALKLNPDFFLQVHRNAIVQLRLIKEVIQGDNMKLVLQNETRVPVSRSHKKIIKDKILKNKS